VNSIPDPVTAAGRVVSHRSGWITPRIHTVVAITHFGPTAGSADEIGCPALESYIALVGIFNSFGRCLASLAVVSARRAPLGAQPHVG